MSGIPIFTRHNRASLLPGTPRTAYPRPDMPELQVLASLTRGSLAERPLEVPCMSVVRFALFVAPRPRAAAVPAGRNKD